MSRHRSISVASAAALLLGAWTWACTDRTTPYGDDPWPDADADVDADVDADADGDEDGEGGDGDVSSDADQPDVEGGPGPVTQVANSAGLTVERVCDLDGDGREDNVLADLGSPQAELTAMALNSIIEGRISDGLCMVIHFPWLDDRAGPTDPEAVAIMLNGVDEDDPPDPSDNFDGDEGFWVDPSELDACGEPMYYYDPVSFVDGALYGAHGTMFLPLADEVPIHAAALTGTIEPGGAGGQFLVCAYGTIRELGEAPGLEEAGGELSMLEIFLAGGTPIGLALIPGLNPDLDMDHDGLEQILLDGDYHVMSCVDGDRTIVAGPDCWRDERFADAFSMTLELGTVPARFRGRPDGWERLVTGTCDDGPPDPSLFDRR